MGKKAIIWFIIVIVLAFVVVFLALTNEEQYNPLEPNLNPDEMVNCGVMDTPACFISRVDGCLPVTGILEATDGKTRINITLLGSENEICHFQRKVDNVVNLDCYFPKSAMSWSLIDQTFGNDNGLQDVVDESC